jgi:ElaB/YqjD/DUF883 family membrane-anchored ribosome-binding protein
LKEKRMNSDSIADTIKDSARKTEKATDNFTKDAETQIKGVSQQWAGMVQKAYGQLADSVTERPISSILITGAIGCMLGLLSRKR